MSYPCLTFLSATQGSLTWFSSSSSMSGCTIWSMLYHFSRLRPSKSARNWLYPNPSQIIASLLDSGRAPFQIFCSKMLRFTALSNGKWEGKGYESGVIMHGDESIILASDTENVKLVVMPMDKGFNNCSISSHFCAQHLRSQQPIAALVTWAAMPCHPENDDSEAERERRAILVRCFLYHLTRD